MPTCLAPEMERTTPSAGLMGTGGHAPPAGAAPGAPRVTSVGTRAPAKGLARETPRVGRRHGVIATVTGRPVAQASVGVKAPVARVPGRKAAAGPVGETGAPASGRRLDADGSTAHAHVRVAPPPAIRAVGATTPGPAVEIIRARPETGRPRVPESRPVLPFGAFEMGLAGQAPSFLTVEDLAGARWLRRRRVPSGSVATEARPGQRVPVREPKCVVRPRGRAP